MASVWDHPAVAPGSGPREEEAEAWRDWKGSVGDPEDEGAGVEPDWGGRDLKRARAGSRAERCQEVEQRVLALGLEKAWEIRPLLDGKALISALNIKGGGPVIGLWVEKAMDWQLANPDGTKAECLDWLREQQKKDAT
eukprot:TRINITY_DN8569_c0_g1_i2.p1 TRINITY_DN8569_c0_g1~~TRINITY_DN8569_c0_g1_i2.p1  ORF type:complete len:138 (+),score=40.71 TRINITY_DN8569_c0_g1_i2:189-602(+)